jgi:hypothetical protein
MDHEGKKGSGEMDRCNHGLKRGIALEASESYFYEIDSEPITFRKSLGTAPGAFRAAHAQAPRRRLHRDMVTAIRRMIRARPLRKPPVPVSGRSDMYA